MSRFSRISTSPVQFENRRAEGDCDADPEENQRSFTFDYSFWSHDGFKMNENNIAVADPGTGTGKYADQ